MIDEPTADSPEGTHAVSSGDVVWLALSATVGHEQSGHRPALIVAGEGYLTMTDTLALVVPLTSTDRGWPNHVPVTGQHGLGTASLAMTEQLRAVSRTRITAVSGTVDEACLAEVRTWLADYLDLPTVPQIS